MKPTYKASAIERFLGGRTKAIEEDRCVFCPKKVIINQFRNQISLKEYRISGLCQSCQDEMFGLD